MVAASYLLIYAINSINMCLNLTTQATQNYADAIILIIRGYITTLAHCYC